MKKGQAVMILLHNRREIFHTYIVTDPDPGTMLYFRHKPYKILEKLDHDVNGGLVRHLHLEKLEKSKD